MIKLDFYESFNVKEFKKLYNKRVHHIDFAQAKKDVHLFIKDPSSLELWSQGFFEQIGDKIHFSSGEIPLENRSKA